MAAVLRGQTVVAPTVAIHRHTARSRTPYILVAGAIAAVTAAVAIALTGGSHSKSRVAPVSPGGSAAAQAHNLEVWLKTYSQR